MELTFRNALVVLSIELTTVLLTPSASVRAELPWVVPSEAPSPNRAYVCGAAWVTSCTLLSITTLGWNPTPVMACAAGAAPAALLKLPGLTLTPLTASENTRAAAALAAWLKLTVKPSASIDTHEAFFCTGKP